MKKLLILYPFLLFCLISKADNQLKLTNWEIKSTTEISENAEKVSMPSFQATDWYEATVPTTVLNALVKQNVYPDPRIGMNNFLIPDVSDEFNKKMDLANTVTWAMEKILGRNLIGIARPSLCLSNIKTKKYG